MTAAAASIKYRGPRTIDHIARIAKTVPLGCSTRSATMPVIRSIAEPLKFLLAQYLEQELLRRYDRGIVSFGLRATCPLMWSHYGDQHRGICAGYSIPADAAASLHKITYGGSRNVKASDVVVMDIDSVARRRVDEAVLLRKAGSWRYEREWRLIGTRGPQDSPLELEEVIFGMRCGSTVKYTITKALENRGREIRFYEMRERHGTFQLMKCVLDIGELSASLPRRTRGLIEAFDAVCMIIPGGNS